MAHKNIVTVLSHVIFLHSWVLAPLHTTHSLLSHILATEHMHKPIDNNNMRNPHEIKDVGRGLHMLFALIPCFAAWMHASLFLHFLALPSLHPLTF